MTNLPEDGAHEPAVLTGDSAVSGPAPSLDGAEEPATAHSSPEVLPSSSFFSSSPVSSGADSPGFERPLFQSFTLPPVRRPERIPNFGHLLLLSLLMVVAFSILIIVLGVASHFHLFGLQLSQKSATDLGINVLSEVILYFATFGLSLFVFPLVWHESLFAGLQWRGRAALAKFRRLLWTAAACFALALFDQVLMPGPANSPIEKMISSPRAAWLMFAFGVTVAPFFEEMFFRGFLLPALCTACDWISEKTKHTLPRPLDAEGHPQWSLPAMVIGSVLTSLPFAGLHLQQQGHSLGPFLLLIVVSMILCAVRLKFKSLAASTLVHASYNFFIFSLTFAATGGFRHFDKM